MMMGKRYLAVTQLELNVPRGETGARPPSRVTRDNTGAPVQHFLQALLLDPSQGWSVQRLDLAFPGASDGVDLGQFVVSAMGDVDGDGRPELVYGVTLDPSHHYVLAYRHDGTRWRALPIIKGLSSLDFIRTIAIGDLDEDGTDEIVLGTRPNGAVLLLDRDLSGYVATTIDRDQYGTGTTNTREVAVADVNADGVLEILVATARAGPENWQATPGAIFLYRRSSVGWDRILIDDHGARTHTRMVAVADVKDDGIRRIISSAVGVVQPASGHIDPKPELRAYALNEKGAVCEPIGTLEDMIKSRSFAAGDIDGNGRTALVVGTRALGVAGLERTCLYVYRFNSDTQRWERETLDTSGPLGFHCVAIADVDGDGRSEVIASDDGRGLIKLYKRQGNGWRQETIYAADGPIFCNALHLVEL